MILRSLAAIAATLTFSVQTVALANEAAAENKKLELRSLEKLIFELNN